MVVKTGDGGVSSKRRSFLFQHLQDLMNVLITTLQAVAQTNKISSFEKTENTSSSPMNKEKADTQSAFFVNIHMEQSNQ